MFGLCPTCTVGTIPASFTTCLTTTATACSKYAVLWKCGYQVANVLDMTELDTAIDNGDIVLLPRGNFTFPAPTQTTVDIDCEEQVAVNTSYLIDYNTSQVTSDISHYDFWKAVQKNASAYRVMFVDSHNDLNAFWVTDNYATAIDGGAPATVAGETPGFQFSLPIIPHPVTGDGDLQNWVAQFRIKYEGIPCRRQIPGLASLIQTKEAA